MGEPAHKKLREYHYKCEDCGDTFNSMSPSFKHCMECGGKLVRS